MLPMSLLNSLTWTSSYIIPVITVCTLILCVPSEFFWWITLGRWLLLISLMCVFLTSSSKCLNRLSSQIAKCPLRHKFSCSFPSGHILTLFTVSAVFFSMAGQSENLHEWCAQDQTLPVFDLIYDQLHTIFWTIPMFIQARVFLTT